MNKPFIIDAHLDLSMNALEWNRDLRQPLKEINRREIGMTDKPDRGNATISFEELRKGNVGLVVATQIGRYPARNFDRGHQIPNADRSGNATMQAQTFYFSNMTPQNYSLNQNPWAALEKMARDNWMCSDTLYVVTGAYWNPGSTFATPDIDGKQCPVPNYYFKVFVRTVKGNVRQAGDRLGDYPADQLKSIGFWVENAGGQGTARSWVKSVSEVESLTGFEFFPSVPAAVKAQKDAASWGL